MSVLDVVRIDGARALVTGASRGIGRAVALALAEDGADPALSAPHRRESQRHRPRCRGVRPQGRRGGRRCRGTGVCRSGRSGRCRA
ncbi:SDR family NAD(P)-dependent oxidoreductase [Streptomyces sp. NPDC001834]|uniref:SDR family NAD(P)-dependent oxidoreductase n=1 Tax=Streptomyces sp. NPDC001834 TaxID=3364616 RepID=UPI00368EE392